MYGWRADLAVAWRLVGAGGRAGVGRVLLAAIGIGLCLNVLLLICSVSPALQARGDRIYVPALAGTDVATFAWHDAGFAAAGRTVSGLDLRALTPTAPVPPGTTRFPAAGELLVSPSLRDALAADPHGPLATQLAGTVVGTIDPSALPGPRDLVFYAGVADLPATFDGQGSGGPATEWSPGLTYGLGTRLITVLVAGGTVMVVSLLLFVALAGRLGGAARDRRWAAVRLIGVGPGRLRRLVGTEAALVGVLGVAVGWAGFLGLRLLAPRLVVDGSGFAATDLWPGSSVAVAATVLVLLVAVLPSLLASRRRLVEPLGVVRRPAARPRAAWRVAFVAGSGLLTFLAVTKTGALQSVPVLGGYWVIALPAVLLLCCVPVTLPWVLDRLSRRWSGGSPAVQMAVGRIRQDPVTAARTAGGVSLALAGAIAMVTLLSLGGGLTPTALADHSAFPARARATVSVLSLADLTGVRQRLAQVVGVTHLAVFSGGPAGDSSELRVADCGTIRALTDATSCADGEIFALTNTTTGEPPPATGTRLPMNPGSDATHWQVGADVVPVRSAEAAGIWFTPAAFRVALPALASQPATIMIQASIPDGSLVAAREALAPYGWRAAGAFATRPGVLGLVVPGLVIGSLLCLLICALGQFVVTAEMVNERRRSLALAAAAGVPRRTLSGSVLAGAAVPVVAGALVALLFGTVLANALLRLAAAPPGVDAGHTAWMSAAAIVFVVFVALATIPMLGRATRPSGLRTE